MTSAMIVVPTDVRRSPGLPCPDESDVRQDRGRLAEVRSRADSLQLSLKLWGSSNVTPRKSSNETCELVVSWYAVANPRNRYKH
jgi:hypothetical protein